MAIPTPNVYRRPAGASDGYEIEVLDRAFDLIDRQSVGAVAAAAWWHAASTARTTGTSHADAAGGDGGDNLMATATAMVVVWKRKGERWPRIYRQAAGGEGGRRLLQGIVTDSPRRLLSC